MLYSLYVNNFEMHLLSDNCPSVEIQLINIFLLLYADDTVLIAETPEGLQTMLNSLYSWWILIQPKLWSSEMVVELEITKIGYTTEIL